MATPGGHTNLRNPGVSPARRPGSRTGNRRFQLALASFDRDLVYSVAEARRAIRAAKASNSTMKARRILGAIDVGKPPGCECGWCKR